MPSQRQHGDSDFAKLSKIAAVLRDGFRISRKGVPMCKGGFALLILYHFS